MQYTATLSSQNQIIIPKIVRQALGVEAGESITFDLSAQPLVSVKKNQSFLSLAGCLKSYVKGKVLTDKEIDRRISVYKIQEYAQKEDRSR
ncbi:MAG: hypothetical protein ABIJ03_04485 [Patescibacteria group bacterium]|nr:hypothetical protein [Patescibacteria group bacterium]